MSRKHSEEELKVLVAKVMKSLREIYEEKGRNYTFKCSYLAGRIGISSHLLAYLLRRLPIGLVRVKSRSNSRKISVYKTYFGETYFDG